MLGLAGCCLPLSEIGAVGVDIKPYMREVEVSVDPLVGCGFRDPPTLTLNGKPMQRISKGGRGIGHQHRTPVCASARYRLTPIPPGATWDLELDLDGQVRTVRVQWVVPEVLGPKQAKAAPGEVVRLKLPEGAAGGAEVELRMRGEKGRQLKVKPGNQGVAVRIPKDAKPGEGWLDVSLPGTRVRMDGCSRLWECSGSTAPEEVSVPVTVVR